MLRTYLAILRRRTWVIALVAVATLVGALIGTSLLPRTYESTTMLRVATADYGTEHVNYDAVMYASRLTNTYSKLVTSESAVSEMVTMLGLAEPVSVKIDIPPNTELMRIIVAGHDPSVTADAANALAEILIARVNAMSAELRAGAPDALGQRLAELEAELSQPTVGSLSSAPADSTPAAAMAARALELKQERYVRLLDQYDRLRMAEAARGNSVSVVERASVPVTPTKPHTPLILAIALAMGLVGGTGLAFLFEHLDTRLYTSRRIKEAVNLRLLGSVPAASKGRQHGLFDADSPEREAFRRIRTHLLSFRHGARQTLLVTSAEPGEGKSTVVANLAAALAEVGRSVIVVDGDLRRPTLHRFFGLPNRTGLSSILSQEVIWDQAVQDSGMPNVKMIASGPPTSNPAALLGRPQMAELIEQLAQSFDVVLLDAPSLLAVADAVALAPLVDGVVLIVARAHAREEAVQAACWELAAVKANTVGFVMNRAEPDASSRYYRHAACWRADEPAPVMTDASLGRGWGALRRLRRGILATWIVVACAVLLLFAVHWNASRQDGTPPRVRADPVISTVAFPGCEPDGAADGGTDTSLREGLTADSPPTIASMAAPGAGFSSVASQQMEPSRTAPGRALAATATR